MVPTLICQRPTFYLKKLKLKRGITQNYSYQSYDPCFAIASCHDEQVSFMGYNKVFAGQQQLQQRRSSDLAI